MAEVAVEMIATHPKVYSVDEYLEFERDSQERHDYIDGRIVGIRTDETDRDTGMTGGTPNHNAIALNLASELNVALKRLPHRIFVADQRIWIPEKKMLTYPDVAVVAEELSYYGDRKDTITNPIAIAEVLSNSTKAYDRGEKFAAYRTLPSLQEYWLVEQYSICVEQYVRTSQTQWAYSVYEEADAEIASACLPFKCLVSDLYV
ncbi:MAG: Uma2 family endonuclease [Cyanobacteria bacterium J06639_1]